MSKYLIEREEFFKGDDRTLAQLLGETTNERKQDAIVKVKRLSEDAIIPTKAHETDAGFDLYAAEDVIIEPGETVKVPLGLAFELPEGFEMQIRPRSGITSKTKLRVQFGTVDCGYIGEVSVIVDNTCGLETFEDFTTGLTNGNYEVDRYSSDMEYDETVEVEGKYYPHIPNVYYEIRKGDRIAQGVIQRIPAIKLEEVSELSSSDRGEGGFGSSGV